MKFEFQATQISLDNVLKDIEAKKIDLSPSLQYQPQRTDYLIYTHPYYKSSFGFFVSVQNPPDLTSDSLINLKISCEKSSSTNNYLRKNYPEIEIIECPTEKDGLLLLSQGRVDVHAGSVDVCEYFIGAISEFGQLVLWKDLPLEYQNIYMAVRKDWPELASIINKAMAKMPPETRNDIIRQYKLELYWKHYQPVIYTAGIALCIVLVGLSIALFIMSQRNKKMTHYYRLAKDKAEKSAHFKSAFLANMSHEIRSPMNAILGLATLLKIENDANERTRYLEYIEKSGKQLLGLINDILEISRMETGEFNLEINTFNVRHLLEELHSTYRPLAEEKKLFFKIEESVLLHKIYLKSDRTKLMQILSNLVSNAIKYTEKGEIALGIQFDNDEKITFFVRDTGVGIPENMRELIFERFKRLDETKHILGTGLGLSITKGLGELLGGQIRLESNQPEGSVFYLTLPYQPNLNPEIPEKEQKKQVKHQYRFNQQTVLLAEDQDFNFVYLEQVLKKAGLHVIRAHNGNEAVILVKTEQIDVVLMDLKMPIKNGYEATREIKKINAHLPVIIQSAYALEAELNKAYQYGADDYIVKPIDQVELLEKVGRFISWQLEVV